MGKKSELLKSIEKVEKVIKKRKKEKCRAEMYTEIPKEAFIEKINSVRATYSNITAHGHIDCGEEEAVQLIDDINCLIKANKKLYKQGDIKLETRKTNAIELISMLLNLRKHRRKGDTLVASDTSVIIAFAKMMR